MTLVYKMQVIEMSKNEEKITGGQNVGNRNV